MGSRRWAPTAGSYRSRYPVAPGSPQTNKAPSRPGKGGSGQAGELPAQPELGFPEPFVQTTPPDPFSRVFGPLQFFRSRVVDGPGVGTPVGTTPGRRFSRADLWSRRVEAPATATPPAPAGVTAMDLDFVPSLPVPGPLRGGGVEG